ncbi:MAG TPA: tripartite tricarboxylate transporter substrate-binding protein [Ramlibacter sp.]|nr:tripartite tricarboxylate transporter substrate-binding protein [Ramlibacter sp.]
MKNPLIFRSRRALLALAALSLVATAAPAEEAWPSKPLRLIVPYPAGVPGDIIARYLQPALQAALKQPVLVENRAGAGGNIGMQEVLRSTDDHTVLWGVDTMFTINPHIYRKLGFKPLEAFQPVTQLASFSQMLVCNASVPVNNLQDLLSLAGAKEISYASGGSGVPGHLAMEMLLSATQVKMTHVPYRGTMQAVQDLIGGAVPCGFLASPVVGPFLKEGRLRALAVSGSKRLAMYPQVPTVDESGVKGFDATFTEMVAVPKSLAPEKVARLQQAIVTALSQPEAKARLAALELEVVANPSEQAATRLRTESARWGAVATRIKLQVD